MSSITTFRSLTGVAVTDAAFEALQANEQLPARSLEKRRAGSGPTSAISVAASGISSSGDTVVVKASGGLLVAPIYIGAISAAILAADALPITKSGATYVVSANPGFTLSLGLPPVASSAGFKFDLVAGFAFGSSINIYTTDTIYTTQNLRVNDAVFPVFFSTAGIQWDPASSGTATIGDYLHFECTGIHWLVSGCVTLLGSIDTGVETS